MTIKLAQQTQKSAGIPNGMRTATIAAVSTKGITISLSGGTFTSGVGVVTSYAPRVGDVVAVFRQDSSWLILGPTSAVNGWQTFAALGYQNGWADKNSFGFPRGQYRVTAMGVQLIAEIATASTPTSGQIIVAGLPVPTAQSVLVASMGAVRVRIGIDNTGTLKIYDATASGTLQLCGVYPLDPITP